MDESSSYLNKSKAWLEESFQDKEILDKVYSTTSVSASLTCMSFCLFLAMNKVCANQVSCEGAQEEEEVYSCQHV